MNNYKKGFAIPLVIAIIALLGIGGGAYVYVNNKSAEKIENSFKEIAKNQVATTTNVVGNDKDENGCIGSAGYTWCEVKNKCLRTWEEKCEVATKVPDPTKQIINESGKTAESPTRGFVTGSISTSIRVISPNSGEILIIGKSYNVKWWDDSDAGNKTIYAINSTSEETLIPISENSFMRSSGIDGTYNYTWKIGTDVLAGKYKIMVCKENTKDCDTGNYFSVVADSMYFANVDAKIKSKMAAMRGSAELFYDENNGSYLGLCSGNTPNVFPSVYDEFKSIGEIVGTQNTNCLSIQNKYSVRAKLNNNTFWCVDSTGFTGTTSSLLNSETCK